MKTLNLGTETGSLINHLYSTGNNEVEPKVGMKVTELRYTDRSVYTIISINKGVVTLLDEWDNKIQVKKYRGNWCTFGETIEFVKELEEDYGAHDIYKEKGGTYNGMFMNKIIDGVTRLKKNYNKKNLVFDLNDPYFDPHF